MRLHDDEIDLDTDLVRLLVSEQFPDLVGQPVEPVPEPGSSNWLFRVGSDRAVRLPRQRGGSASLAKEKEWGPTVARHLRVPTPEVLGVGRPAHGYPEPWLVTTWLEGRTPRTPLDSPALARDLAGVVTALRSTPVPAQAYVDPDLRWYRGGRLAAVDEAFHAALVECRALPDLDVDLAAARRVWEEALAAEESRPASRGWFHGDLLAENLLLAGDRLVGVLDLGGVGVGDPTVDLVVAWEVLSPSAREVFRETLGVDDRAWAVGRGWAVLLALITFPYYGATMPRRRADRLVLVRQALAG